MAEARNDNREAETGRYTNEYEQTPTEAIENGNQTTSEIADFIGCSYQTAYYHLQRMEKTNAVDREMIGNTSVWRLI